MNEETDLVTRARAGDRAALEALVRTSKDLVYNLAIRMLGDRTEAEDMAQEILIRIVTGLATFRGESAFRTWVYRVASNHLLTARRKHAENKRIQSFEAMEEMLDAGIAADLPPLDDQMMVGEAKLRCTNAMIASLDRDHRIAYILGEILDLSSEEGAEVLEIAPDAFRKRRSRARERLHEFMTKRCGLVDEKNRCRCAKQAAAASARGHLSLTQLRWANHAMKKERIAPTRSAEQAQLDDLHAIQRVVEVFRAHPEYDAPASLVEGLKELLEKSDNVLLQ